MPVIRISSSTASCPKSIWSSIPHKIFSVYIKYPVRAHCSILSWFCRGVCHQILQNQRGCRLFYTANGQLCNTLTNRTQTCSGLTDNTQLKPFGKLRLLKLVYCQCLRLTGARSSAFRDPLCGRCIRRWRTMPLRRLRQAD